MITITAHAGQFREAIGMYTDEAVRMRTPRMETSKQSSHTNNTENNNQLRWKT